MALTACGDESETADTPAAEVSEPAAAPAEVEAEVEVATGDETPATEEVTTPATTVEDVVWGNTCAADADCGNPTDYCVKQPGDAEGYCSIQCASTSVCGEAGAGEWTCNAVNCMIPQLTWCGPKEEIAESNNFLKECE